MLDGGIPQKALNNGVRTPFPGCRGVPALCRLIGGEVGSKSTNELQTKLSRREVEWVSQELWWE